MNDGVDPITLEVLGNRFSAIAEEMETVLLRSSYSAIVKEALDASAAVFDADGRTLAQADSIPAHLGMLVRSVRRVTETVGSDPRPGDLYVLNDPYDGGTHLPDVTIVAPAFHSGRLVGFAATMAHHQDIGGKAPGSTAPDAFDLTAEGFRIPPLKLFDAGERNETFFALARANVRVPDNFEGDVGAQVAACRRGAERLAEVVEAHGAETVQAAGGALLDYAERLTRRAIEAVPDGDYSFVDYLDDDGVSPDPIRIEVKATIRGSDIHFDFTGTGPQAKGAINCVPSSTMSAVYYCVRALAGPGIPRNDGVHRPITATLPPGTLVNPDPPAPVGARTLAFKRIADACMGALAQAAPGRVTAASNGQANLIYVGGFDPLKERYFVGFLGVPMAGGMGARPDRDGIDLVETDMTNCIHYPTEACEAELPMRINRIELWPDSGGAGRFRGGLGYVSEVEWLRGEAIVTIRRDRHKFHPWGLAGGQAAPLCRFAMRRADGSEEDLPSKTVTRIRAGDRLLVWTTGGGGYGPPSERDPDAVRADLREGRITPEAARRDYGPG